MDNNARKLHPKVCNYMSWDKYTLAELCYAQEQYLEILKNSVKYKEEEIERLKINLACTSHPLPQKNKPLAKMVVFHPHI